MAPRRNAALPHWLVTCAICGLTPPLLALCVILVGLEYARARLR